MTDDYTKEIKERLAAATPGKCIGAQENGLLIMERENDLDDIHKFHRNTPTDIANLLAEREVLREALEFYARAEQILSGSDYQYHGTSSFRHATDDNGEKANQALAWEPGK